MTNHVHILSTPSSTNGIYSMTQTLGRQYMRYFNYTYKRTGTLWEGRYKYCPVDANNYLLICQINPVRADMVEAPGNYIWSSYRSNRLEKDTKLCTPHYNYLSLGRPISKGLMFIVNYLFGN